MKYLTSFWKISGAVQSAASSLSSLQPAELPLTLTSYEVLLQWNKFRKIWTSENGVTLIYDSITQRCRWIQTLFVLKKGTWNSAAFSVSIGFPLPCFIKIGYDISASTACLSHLFIEHAILEISSIKMLVKIHPAYRTDSNFFWWTTLTDNNRLI